MKEPIKTICPKCNKEYVGCPSLSRVDNETLICPDCGTREALESIGVSTDEIEKIIGIIDENRPKNT
ncbi:MAG: hypothetical protein PHX51_02310 [Clostridia bacterium]|nr:hypothetical protein [Clostridia bacterium]